MMMMIIIIIIITIVVIIIIIVWQYLGIWRYCCIAEDTSIT